MDNEERVYIDYINVACIIIGIGIIASYGWPMVFILAPIYYAQKYIRKTPAVQEWSQKLLSVDKRALLRQEKKQEIIPAQKYQLKPYTRDTQQLSTSVRVKEADQYSHLPLWQRVTKPLVEQDIEPAATRARRIENAENRQLTYLQQALRRLPEYIHYTALPDEVPSKLSVPIGVTMDKVLLWGDFDADGEQSRILHALIAGQTGSGKDAILRLWF